MLHIQGHGVELMLSDIRDNIINNSISLDLIYAIMLKT